MYNKNISCAIMYVRHGSKTPFFAAPDIYFLIRIFNL
jgi:hypothetical protein